MKEILEAIVLFLVSTGTFILSVRSFKEKGYLFNNAYIFASEQERAKMDKAPHYRQSGIVFLMIGIILLLLAIEVLLVTKWLLYAAVALLSFLLLYAIISGVVIEKRK